MKTKIILPLFLMCAIYFSYEKYEGFLFNFTNEDEPELPDSTFTLDSLALTDSILIDTIQVDIPVIDTIQIPFVDTILLLIIDTNIKSISYKFKINIKYIPDSSSWSDPVDTTNYK